MDLKTILLQQLNEELEHRRYRLSLRILDVFEGLKPIIEAQNEVRLPHIIAESLRIADSDPSRLVANLLVLVDSENQAVLDPYVLSNCGLYLRDVLKHERVLKVLAEPITDEDQENPW